MVQNTDDAEDLTIEALVKHFQNCSDTFIKVTLCRSSQLWPALKNSTSESSAIGTLSLSVTGTVKKYFTTLYYKHGPEKAPKKSRNQALPKNPGTHLNLSQVA